MCWCNPISADYARVLVQELHPDDLEDELDLPTLDGIQDLGDAKNNFLHTFEWGNIILDRTP